MPYKHRVTVAANLHDADKIVAGKEMQGGARINIRHTKEKLAKDYIFLLNTDYTATYNDGSVHVLSITITNAKFKYADESHTDTIDYTFGEDDYRLAAKAIRDELTALMKSRNMDVSPDRVDATKYRIRVDTSNSESKNFSNRHFGVLFSASNATAHGNLPICVTDDMKLIVRFSTRLDITKENAVFINGIETQRKVAKINSIRFQTFEADALFWSDESKRKSDAVPTYHLTEEDLEHIKSVIADKISARYYELQFPFGRNALTF